MAEQWPLTLQQKFNEQGFSEKMGNTTIRSKTEIGLEKVRRRYTKGIDDLSGSIDIEKSDIVTFKNFYKTTLNGGVLSFEFTDPYTEVLEEFRFDTSSPPVYNPKGGNTFILSFNLERIP